MRNRQLVRFKDEPSRLSFANQLLVEKEERYDFVPRILGTSITISIGQSVVCCHLASGNIPLRSRVFALILTVYMQDVYR